MKTTLATLILTLAWTLGARAAEPAPPAAGTAPSAAPAAAPAPAGDPRAIVEARYQQIQRIIAENADENAMRDKVKALTAEFVDFETFSRETIRSEWEDLKDSQRAEFVAWFTRLIKATYARHFKPRQDLKIAFRADTEFRADRAQVETTLTFEKSSVDVDYRFLQRPAEGATPASWWVYDIVIDEVSLMRNYRSQFRKVLKKDGFDALMAKIKAAVERKEKGSDPGDEI